MSVEATVSRSWHPVECVSRTDKLDSMTRFGVVPDIFWDPVGLGALLLFR
jgi:hypothetical protein